VTRTRKSLLTVASVATGLLVVAACGSSGGSGSSGGTTNQQSSGSGASLTVRKTPMGSILADSSGRTVYVLTANGADVKCTGACLSVWPPVLLTGNTTPQKVAGVSGTLSTVDQGGQKQLTVNGHPVYTYSADSKRKGIIEKKDIIQK